MMRGDIIAAAMLVVFITRSPGLALIVTFVPGVSFAFGLLLWIYHSQVELPDQGELSSIYFAALAVQLIHFAEEYAGDFAAKFPELYGGDPIVLKTFVTFNMVMYAIFLLSGLAYVSAGSRLLLLPMTFFVVYGVLGNAISHTVWLFIAGGYFPGAITASVYWIVSPVILRQFLRSRRLVVWFIVGVVSYVVPTLVLRHAIS